VGIEAVLASGEIIDLLSKYRKDNTGYDLKQLLIGSEGTLGVITKAAIHCPQIARYKSVALLYTSSDDFESFVSQNLIRARTLLGESLSGFEFIDQEALRLLPKLPPGLPQEIGKTGFAILVECSSSAEPVDHILTRFLETSFEAGPGDVLGVVASDLEGMKKLWNYRESVSSGIAKVGPNLKYDLSLPHNHYYEIVKETRREFGHLKEVVAVVGYGHVGDGNVHLNVALEGPKSVNPHETDIGKRISEYVFSRVNQLGGSISAEHGIGRDKKDKLALSKPPEVIRLMKSIKKVFDPVGILNPGRVL
jgi:FAD/FMN-containing dehydrogenase